MECIGPNSSVVMAVIWIIYLQLFFIQYRHNSRPYLAIHHAQHESAAFMCATTDAVVCAQRIFMPNNWRNGAKSVK